MKRAGFTLVEMLVVITIIAILAGIVTAVAFTAIPAAKRSAMRVEVNRFVVSLSLFSQKMGSYPPSDLSAGNKQAIMRFLAKAYPRCDANATADGIIALNLNPAEALVFWLGGFSSNVRDPVFSKDVDSRTSWFDFDKTRLVAADSTIPPGWYLDGGTLKYNKATYHPQHSHAPYVYFEFHDYLRHAKNPTDLGTYGQVVPYMHDHLTATSWDANGNGQLDANEARNLFVESNSYQVLAGGLDASYGDLPSVSPVNIGGVQVYRKLYPTGTGYLDEDRDNVASFFDGGQLEDAMP